MNRNFPRFSKDQTPTCPGHGKMKLMPPDKTPFLSQRIATSNCARPERQIYRCLKCPRVAPGPFMAEEPAKHGGHEIGEGWLKSTNPY